MQIYHANFPSSYLRSLNLNGIPLSGITLERTAVFDMVKPNDRVEFLDAFVGILSYLLSGNSRVGFLSNRNFVEAKSDGNYHSNGKVRRNPIHGRVRNHSCFGSKTDKG